MSKFLREGGANEMRETLLDRGQLAVMGCGQCDVMEEGMGCIDRLERECHLRVGISAVTSFSDDGHLWYLCS